MELEKFEQKAQQVLQEREIKPSEESWEKLESRLTRKNRNSRPYLKWFAVAATVAAGIFLTGIGNIGTGTGSEPIVVEEPAPLEEIKPEQEEVMTEVAVAGESRGQSGKTTSWQPVSTIRSLGVKSHTGKRLAGSLPSLKVRHQVAEESRPQTTEAEINALLETAMAEVQQEHTEIAQAHKAEKLLEQVEFELEESFRHKVFEVLKDGFSKARTAVANRNP